MRWEDAALVRYARGRDALCLYGWKHYMYNPQLKRWLGRIAVPTLVLWGASDRIVTPDYGRAYAGLIPGARFALIDAAGHHPEIEQPEAFADRVVSFIATHPSNATHSGHQRNPWTSGGSAKSPIPIVPQDVLAAADSVRGSLPNKWCDPKVAADLFEEVLDEFLLCDDEGMNVLAIEHHAGINSLMAANPMFVGILARQTRKVRILSLGTLVSLREDPVRIAEEYATADVMSRGRLEIGFVKSGGTEMASNHTNPVGNLERYWEAIDLIRKTLTHA